MAKKQSKSKNIASQEIITNKILFIRGQKVMLDKDLALLYGVETKVLNQAVKRNLERFPEDFMFQMIKEEVEHWRSQFAILNHGESSALRSHSVTLKRGQHRKYLPYAFTEQGVAMLSSVLNSNRAIQVNIQIMRTFTKLREMMADHKDLKNKIEAMEKNTTTNLKLSLKRSRSCSNLLQNPKAKSDSILKIKPVKKEILCSQKHTPTV